MQINMNDFVSVKLTEDGKIILESYRWSMKYMLESKGFKGFELPVPKPDENGYFRFQLWNLMYIFGPYIGMGMPIPFENNAVVIDVDLNDSAYPPVKITHWMPLPKLPKEDGGSECSKG